MHIMQVLVYEGIGGYAGQLRNLARSLTLKKWIFILLSDLLKSYSQQSLYRISGMARHLSIQTITNNPLRIMLHQIPSSWQISDLPKSLHLIEELQQYTTPGFFLSECSFNQLMELVERTYHAFGSTYSAHMALLKDEKAMAEYFSQFFDPQHQCLLPWI